MDKILNLSIKGDEGIQAVVFKCEKDFYGEKRQGPHNVEFCNKFIGSDEKYHLKYNDQTMSHHTDGWMLPYDGEMIYDGDWLVKINGNVYMFHEDYAQEIFNIDSFSTDVWNYA